MHRIVQEVHVRIHRFFLNSLDYMPNLVNIFWICGWAVDDFDWMNIPMHCCGNAVIWKDSLNTVGSLHSTTAV